MIDIAELRIDHRHALEVVTDGQLFRHTHAAVQLHCVLRDESPGLADLYLQRRHRAPRRIVISLVQTHRRHQ